MIYTKYTLKEITLNITDGTHSTVEDDAEGDCYLLSCKNIKNGSITIGTNERKISQSTLETLRKRTKTEKNDVLITTVGTIGELALITEDNPVYEFQRSVGIIKPNCNMILPKYMYYSLRNAIPQIKTLVKGAVQQCLFIGDIKEIVLDIPSISNQEKTITLLDIIDRKIATNDSINKNLEEQARLLFKSWFIDFDGCEEEFYDAPHSYAVPKSMNMIQIADIPHVLETGKRPKGGAVSEGIPSVGAENVKQLGVFNASSAKYIPFDYAATMKKGKIKGYELLLYKDGGKPGTFTPHFSMFGEGFPYDEFFINEHVFKLDFNNIGYNEFMYFYLQSDYPYNWLANNGGKAAIPGINQSDVNSIWTYDPQNKKVQEYCDWVQPLFKTILSNCAENQKLSQLRDSLLPKLMSGEIDVSEIKI